MRFCKVKLSKLALEKSETVVADLVDCYKSGFPDSRQAIIKPKGRLKKGKEKKTFSIKNPIF